MLKNKGATLRIHCWGGLGSQLQALSYFLKIELVLHSSGITKRESEIDFLKSQINIRSVQDFVDNQNISFNNSLKYVFLKFFKKPIQFLLNLCKLVITDDNNAMRIMPWTTDIRCTYSKINLNSELIKKLGLLIKFDPKQIRKDIIGVHYRAGDLLTLKRESLIPIKIILEQIEDLNINQSTPKKVVIYSDSDLELVEFKSSSNLEFDFKKTDTLNTILDLASSNVFIGTNSKVSLWVAIIKYGFEIPSLILLPNAMLNSFYTLINPFDPNANFKVGAY